MGGSDSTMELADLIRLGATVPPAELYNSAVKEFERGEIEFSQIMPLYRHALHHAGLAKDKCDPSRCPICRVPL